MGIKENWWRLNYHTVRLAGIPAAKLVLRINLSSEGEIPNTRPVFLAPVHRTSVDTYVMVRVAREFISFVSTDSFGHGRVVNYLQRHSTRAMGSIIWQKNGIPNARHRAVALAHDVEDKLDRRLIVAAFTQGEFQPHSVESVEDGLIGLLRRYETRYEKEKGHELRIPVVPVGIEYEKNSNGFEQAGALQWISRHVPQFPDWTVPAFGSKVVVRFGEAQYFDERSPRQLTEAVMREAANLSNIPYNIAVQRTQGESHRESWRLRSLRGWSDDKTRKVRT